MVECQPDDAFRELLNLEQQRHHGEGSFGSRFRVSERCHSDGGQGSAGNEAGGG